MNEPMTDEEMDVFDQSQRDRNEEFEVWYSCRKCRSVHHPDFCPTDE